MYEMREELSIVYIPEKTPKARVWRRTERDMSDLWKKIHAQIQTNESSLIVWSKKRIYVNREKKRRKKKKKKKKEEEQKEKRKEEKIISFNSNTRNIIYLPVMAK